MSPGLLRILMRRRTGIEARPIAPGPVRAIVFTRTPHRSRKEPLVFVELDSRQIDGYTLSIEWDRETRDDTDRRR